MTDRFLNATTDLAAKLNAIIAPVVAELGFDLIEPKGEHCCGFAGVFCLSYQKLSRGILGKCAQEYEASGADAIITSCPGCIMQLKKEVKNTPVMHLIEALEEIVLQER